jgi:hypothetical protein
MSRLWLVRTLWFFGGALTAAIVAYLVWAHYTSAGSAARLT